MNEDQLAELHAVKAIATTYLREGINIVDAVHEAMRYARWAPDADAFEMVLNDMATGPALQREQIFARLAEARAFTAAHDPSTVVSTEDE